MLQQFIKSNFTKAIHIQSSFNEYDKQMIAGIQSESLTVKLVKDWMRHYSLLQGINNETRAKIASAYIDFARKNKRFKPQDIQPKFQELHEQLKSIKTRKWVSATSKLLWCIEPTIIVIYDAFVKRAILVLQCLDKELATYPRINSSPDSKKDVNSVGVTEYYMNYQNIVNCLYQKNLPLIQSPKEQTDSQYNYDIRIMDKLLWIMGNFKEEFELDQIVALP